MVDQLYLSADVFALPSLSEGSALVVYEAMAAGLPVVVTPNCGAVARDGLDGYVVPIRDPEAIGERLLFLFNHPEVRSQQGASARQWILERYTWQHYRRRVVAAYYALMHDRPIQEAVDRADTEASESAAS
jgi:glycosyltransferase involved in cell wall biosynthesis